MTRPLAILCALLLFTACGKYGPPLRSAPAAANPDAIAEPLDEEPEESR
jgi:predicted small lipoprotein YifL